MLTHFLLYKFAFMLLLCFVPFQGVSAQTQLERLWQLARENSNAVKNASLESQYARDAYRYKNVLFPWSVSTGITSGFNDLYKETVWYTSDATADITVTKRLPGGLALSTSVDYEMSKDLADPYQKPSKTNTAYTHIPSASVALSQSLCPFWLQGLKRDPATLQLSYNLEQKEISQKLQEKNTVQDVTYNFILLRQTQRLIECTEKKIAIYDENIRSLQESLAQGESSAYEVWKMDEERWECAQNLDSYHNSRQNAYETLCRYCGTGCVEKLMDELPMSDRSLYEEHLEQKLLNNGMEQVRNNYAMQKQSDAPVLSLKGNFFEYTNLEKKVPFSYVKEKNYLAWSFTLAVDFSQLSLHKNKLLKNELKTSLESYVNQISESQKQSDIKERQYDSMVELYEDSLRKDTDIAKNRKRYAEDVAEMHKSGYCSYIDMLAAQNEYQTAVCKVENDKDLLWFYKWMKTQND